MLTDKEKEAINIVVDLLDKRNDWLKDNEPTAVNEIKSNQNAAAQVLELEHLKL
jgi:hypothetical protein